MERIVEAQRHYRECNNQQEKLIIEAEIAAMVQKHNRREFT